MKASLAAALRTLAYEDIFDYPLTLEEIYRFQPGKESRMTIEAALRGLMKEGKVEGKEGYFFLRRRKRVVEVRKRRGKWAREKWLIAQKTAAKLKKIPGIRLLAVTGALAVNNCKKEDDIDFLVITSAGYLWLGRAIIYLLAPLLGIKRRRPAERKVKNKICFNLFLEEGSLRVGPPSLFLAHEVAQLKPLVNKDKIYESFLWENRWVRNYLPNAPEGTKSRAPRPKTQDLAIQFVNFFAFLGQYLYMKPKMTVEKVSLHQAFFHPLNLGSKIQEKYEEKLRGLTILK